MHKLKILLAVLGTILVFVFMYVVFFNNTHRLHDAAVMQNRMQQKFTLAITKSRAELITKTLQSLQQSTTAFKEEQAEEIEQEGYKEYIQVFKKDTLMYWNVDKKMPLVNSINYNINTQLLQFHQQWYLTYIQVLKDSTTAYISIPVMDEYLVKNDFIKPFNYLNLNLHKHINFCDAKFAGATPININNKVIGYFCLTNKVAHLGNFIVTHYWIYFSLLVLYLCFGLTFYYSIQATHKHTLFAIFTCINSILAFVLVILFNSCVHLTASSSQVLQHIAIWGGASIQLIFIRAWSASFTINTNKYKVPIYIIITGLLIGSCFLLFKQNINLTWYATLTGNAYEVPILLIPSYQNIFYYLVLFASILYVFMCSKVIKRWSYNFMLSNTTKLLVFISCTMLFTLLAIIYFKEIPMFISLLFGTALVLFNINRLFTKWSFNFNYFNISFLLWIAIISAGMAYILQYNNSKYHYQNMYAYGEFLLDKQNNDFIATLNMFIRKHNYKKYTPYEWQLYFESEVSTLFDIDFVNNTNLPAAEKEDTNKLVIRKKYTNSFKYLLKIADTQSLILKPKSFESLEAMPNILKLSPDYLNSFNVENNYAYALLDSNNTVLYTNIYQASLFKELIKKHKKAGKLLGYKYVFVQETNYSMVVLMQDRGLVDYLFLYGAVFSWLFVFFTIVLIAVVTLKYKGNFKAIRNHFFGSFKHRYFISIIGLELLAFLAILYFVNRYANRTQIITDTNSIFSNLKLVKTELSNKIKKYGDDWNILPEEMQKVKQQFGVDFNMYNPKGNLLYTSLPILYILGLEGKQLHPKVLTNLNNALEGTKDIKKETIGSFNYKLGYMKYYSPNGNLYYITIPYYKQYDQLKLSKLNFLVPLIDTLFLLLIITGIVSYTLINYLNKRIGKLSNAIKQVDIQNANAIDWPYQDELKPLVLQYNAMVIKVEESARQLAISERDNTWRDMAKQIAHEIKNPITPIKLTLQRLQMYLQQGHPELQKHTQRAITTVLEQIDSLNDIATNFALVAKMKDKKLEKFELNELIKNVVYVHKQETETIYVTYNTTVPNIEIIADRDQIKRVLNNIIGNAIQAIPIDSNGIVNVTLNTFNSKAIITIKDSGVGIGEADTIQIFKPYFTTKNTGTGLGLAISKDIIEGHGGNITFTSIVNEGTVFTIQLPVI